MNILILSLTIATLIWSLLSEKRYFIIFFSILLIKYIIQVIKNKNIYKNINKPLFEKPENPSIHTILQVRLKKIDNFLKIYNKKNPDNRITYTHIGLKALSSAMMENNNTNCYISFNNLYNSNTSSIGVMVDINGKDLFVKVVRKIQDFGIKELPSKLKKSIKIIKKGKNWKYKILKKIVKITPGYVFNITSYFLSYLVYDFFYKFENLSFFRKNFGVAGLTNVSSFNVKEAIACHIEMGRSTMVFLMGTPFKSPVVVNGKIEIEKVMNIGLLSDLRLGNGDDFLNVINKIKEVFDNFENYL